MGDSSLQSLRTKRHYKAKSIAQTNTSLEVSSSFSQDRGCVRIDPGVLRLRDYGSRIAVPEFGERWRRVRDVARIRSALDSSKCDTVSLLAATVIFEKIQR